MKIIFLIIVLSQFKMNVMATNIAQDSVVSLQGVGMLEQSNASFPDSLRITIDPAVFFWKSFYYESELRVTALYSSGPEPDSVIIFVDTNPANVTFWARSEQGIYLRRDYLVIYKNQIQAVGKIRWRLANNIEVILNVGSTRIIRKVPEPIPVMLILIALCGGAIGGWLRRTKDPNSMIDFPVRVFPESWSRWVVPLRESIISILAGFLLYLLNMVSPLYLEFRQDVGGGWLVLVQPLLVGFIGGWGGINLLASILNQIFKTGDSGQPPVTE